MSDLERRFWSKVDKNGPVPAHRPELGPCWIWTASRNAGGYGKFKAEHRGAVLAHRWSYEALIGPIPEGLDLDHLCRVHPCVRPSHAEPVTRRANVLRGVGPTADHARRTHCPAGHALEGDNLSRCKLPHRECRACKNAADRRRFAERATA